MKLHPKSPMTLAWNKLEKEDKSFNPEERLKDFDLLIKTAKIIRDNVQKNPKFRVLHDRI